MNQHLFKDFIRLLKQTKSQYIPKEVLNIKDMLCAVTEDAVKDYREHTVNKTLGIKNKKYNKNNDYITAVNYLKGNTVSMDIYCKIIGINPDYIRRKLGIRGINYAK